MKFVGTTWGVSRQVPEEHLLLHTTNMSLDLSPHRGRAGWGDETVFCPGSPCSCLEEAAVTLSHVLMSPGFIFSL